MKNETWEMSTLEWNRKGADGIIINPADVGGLIFSQNKEQAKHAYAVVSEAVGRNGWIYPVALPVVKTVLAALPNCSAAARYECLEIIAHIAAAESAPQAQNVADECLVEIRHAFWYFVYGLQFEDAGLASLYVDILGCLGMKCDDLRCTVEKYLKLALTRNLPGYDVAMVNHTIVGLSK